MKIYRVLESIIKEEGVKTQSEKCVKMFGNELFGPQLGGKEPNTDYEWSVLQDIGSFTTFTYGKMLTKDLVQASKHLKSCMSSYPEVLHPQGILYRGDTMTLRNFLKVDYVPRQWNKIEYVALSPIQSWSETEDVGDDFAASHFNKYSIETIGFIGKANESDIEALIEKEGDKLLDNVLIGINMRYPATPDQFLFKAKYFNLLSQSGMFEDDVEDEVLRIDKRPIIVDAMIPLVFEERVLTMVEKLKLIL